MAEEQKSSGSGSISQARQERLAEVLYLSDHCYVPGVPTPFKEVSKPKQEVYLRAAGAALRFFDSEPWPDEIPAIRTIRAETIRNATHAQLDALVFARKELHSFEDWLKGNIRHLDGLSVSWNSGCGLPGYGPVSRAMGHVVAERWEDLVAEARRMLQRKVDEAEAAIVGGAQ